jgi:hypothetical protein
MPLEAYRVWIVRDASSKHLVGADGAARPEPTYEDQLIQGLGNESRMRPKMGLLLPPRLP